MTDESTVLERQATQTPSRLKYFHVWCLPLVWVMPIGALWADAIANHLNGEHNMIAGLASIGVGWLVILLRNVVPWHFVIDLRMTYGGNLVDGVSCCVCGLVLMAIVGAIQDLLRVPRKIFFFYLATAFLFFFVFLSLFVHRDLNAIIYLKWFLLCISESIYILSFGSCLIFFGIFVVRAGGRRSSGRVKNEHRHRMA